MNQSGVVAPSKHKKRKSKAFRRRTPPGAPPGTLVTDPSAPQPVMTVLAYSPQDFVEQDLSNSEQIRDFLGKWPVVWINVEGIGDAGTVTKLRRTVRFAWLGTRRCAAYPPTAKSRTVRRSSFYRDAYGADR